MDLITAYLSPLLPVGKLRPGSRYMVEYKKWEPSGEPIESVEMTGNFVKTHRGCHCFRDVYFIVRKKGSKKKEHSIRESGCIDMRLIYNIEQIG